MNDLGRGYAADRSEIERAVSRVLESGWYVLGPEVERFESGFSDFCGVGHGIGVGSGTDALIVALRSVGVGAGDEVITAANAGGYSTTAILAIGAVPVYADVQDATLTLDPLRVGGLMSARVKAVVGTHLFGSVCDIAGVRAAVGEGISIVEDGAQAHGASVGGRRVGSLGDVAAFSFYPTKNLGALGDAGMVVTDDAAIAERARCLRQYGWSAKYEVGLAGGLNTRLDPVQSAVLSVRLDRLEARNERRRSILARYRESLAEVGMAVVQGAGGVAHLCVIRHPRREELRGLLRDAGIATDVHYPILDCDQAGWSLCEKRVGELVVSRASVDELLSLPLFPEMTDDDVEAACSAVVASVSMLEGVRS